MDCSTPGFRVLHCLPEFAQTHVYWIDDAMHYLILCLPFLLLLSGFPSIRVFSNELATRIRWPKYWSSAPVLRMNIQDSFPSWLTGLISLPYKGLSRLFSNTFKSITTLAPSLFVVQLSHPYLTTGKTIGLTIGTLVSKVTSLLSKCCKCLS